MENRKFIIKLAEKSIRDYEVNCISLGILVTELERIVDHVECSGHLVAVELRRLWGELEIIISLGEESDLTLNRVGIDLIVGEFSKTIQSM